MKIIGAKLDPDEKIVARHKSKVESGSKSGKILITNKSIIFKSSRERDSYKIQNITCISKTKAQGSIIIEIEYLDGKRSLRNTFFSPVRKSDILLSRVGSVFLIIFLMSLIVVTGLQLMELSIHSCIPILFGVGIIISFIIILRGHSDNQEMNATMTNLFNLISDHLPTPTHSIASATPALVKQPKASAKKVRKSTFKARQISINDRAIDITAPDNPTDIPRTNIVFRCERCGAMLIEGAACRYCENLSQMQKG